MSLHEILAAAHAERKWTRRSYGHHYYVDGAGLILGEVRLQGDVHMAVYRGLAIGQYITEESAKAAVERTSSPSRGPRC